MNQMYPAGFWRRFLAVCIDSVIITLPYLVLDVVFRTLLFRVTNNVWVHESFGWTVSTAMSFTYNGWFLSRKGATPGKAALGLRVTDHATGAHLSFVRAGLRCAVVGPLLLAATLSISVLMIAFRSDKRALHDLIFGSDVWHTKK